jgi:pimeloyl-ACP methyl ester carboxylesterase
VLLLHQSPASSAEMLPLMAQLADDFTVLAPDMPGYGDSDPVPTGPLSMELLSENLAHFMDAIGLESAAIYGFHTGASLATAFARRHPGRVRVAVCEGLLCLTEAERTQFLSRYVERFEPCWDGSHLAWLWTRLKDQALFFPWYERTGKHRLQLDGLSATALDLRVRDWLRSGPGYGAGYLAAFGYNPAPDLCNIHTPHFVLGRAGDPLATHLDRIHQLPGAFKIERHDDGGALLERLRAILRQYAGATSVPATRAARARSGGPWKDLIAVSGGAVRILRAGDPAPRAIVIQHEAQRDLSSLRTLCAAYASRLPVVAIECPGHGETEPGEHSGSTRLEAWVEVMQAVLATLGVEACEGVGLGAGGAALVELARRSIVAMESLTLIAPLDLSLEPALQARAEASVAAYAPDPYGGYLLRAWHEARDQQMFHPWFEQRNASALQGELCLDPMLIHHHMVAAVLAGAAGADLKKAEIRYPLLSRLKALRMPVRLAACAADPRRWHTRQLADSGYPFVSLPIDAGAWASVLGRWE